MMIEKIKQDSNGEYKVSLPKEIASQFLDYLNILRV